MSPIRIARHRSTVASGQLEIALRRLNSKRRNHALRQYRRSHLAAKRILSDATAGAGGRLIPIGSRGFAHAIKYLGAFRRPQAIDWPHSARIVPDVIPPGLPRARQRQSSSGGSGFGALSRAGPEAPRPGRDHQSEAHHRRPAHQDVRRWWPSRPAKGPEDRRTPASAAARWRGQQRSHHCIGIGQIASRGNRGRPRWL